MKMKSLITAIVVAVLCAAMAVSSMAVSFNDTKGHWAEATILELAEQGIINGKGDGIYDPQGTVTRAEFIKLLVCALDEYDETAEFGAGVLADVKTTDWYYRYVASGLDNGVFTMDDLYDTEFLPKTGMSRGDVAVWVTQGLGISAEGECTFTDIADEKVKKAVITAVQEGIITGYEDNTYRPEKTLTRAEAAVIIKRVMTTYASYNTLRESKNEVTYADGFVSVKTDGGNNVLKTIDENTKTIVVENCTAEVLSRKAGEIIFLEPTAAYPKGFLAKISTMTVNGTTATIVCDEPKLEEIFKYIDIAQNLEMSADDYIPGSSSYGIEVEKADGMVTRDGGYIAGDANELILFKFSENARKNLFEEKMDFDARNEDGNGLSGFVTIKADVILDILLDTGKKDFSGSAKVQVVEEAELKYEWSKGYEKRWDLGEFSISIYGPISANIDVDLLFTAEGEFEIVANAYAQADVGIKVAKGKPSVINDFKSTYSLTANAKGEIRLGPTLTVGVGVDLWFWKPINVFDVYGNLGLGIYAETGIEHVLSQENGDVSYTAHNNTPDEEGNIHICDICVDGNIFLFLNGDAGVSTDVTDFLKMKKLRVDFGEMKKELTKWYFSIAGENEHIGKFGLGICPNKFKPITITAQPEGVKGSMGTPIKLSVKAGSGKNGTEKANQVIVYKWFKDGAEIANEFSNSLTIDADSVQDSGSYTCKAYYSALGEKLLFADSEAAVVEIVPFENGPEITMQPQSITVDEGFGVSMSVAATAPAGAMIEFQWYKNGAPIANATASSYSIASASKADEGSYHCVVKIAGFDNLATTSATATLTIKEKANADANVSEGVLDTDIFGGAGNTSLDGLDGNNKQDGGVLDTDIFG